MSETVVGNHAIQTRWMAMAIAAAMSLALGCTKTEGPTEEQVRAIAGEMKEAELQRDSSRYVAHIADDAEITIVPPDRNVLVISKAELKAFLDHVYPKTSATQYSVKDDQVELDGEVARYTARVEEEGVFENKAERQVSKHDWRLALVDGAPKITSMHIEVFKK